MRSTPYRFGGWPEPEITINVVETSGDLRKLDDFLYDRRDLYLGLDAETNAKDPFEHGFKTRMVQMADMTESWVVPIWSECGFFTCGDTVSTMVRRHPRWVAHFAENDERFCARGLPGDPVRWSDAEPHFSDSQVVLAMYDPRTVTTHNKKDRIHPRIPRLRGLKDNVTRLLTPTLAAAETAMDLRVAELAKACAGAPRAKKALKAWGFANIPTYDPAYLLYAALDPIACLRLFELCRQQLIAEGRWDRALASLREQWWIDHATYQGLPVDGPYVRWLDQQLADAVAAEVPTLAAHGIPPSALGPSVGLAFNRLGVMESPVQEQGKDKWNKAAMKALLDKCEEIFADPQYAMVGVPEQVVQVRQLAHAVGNARKAGKYRSTWVEPMLWTLAHADGAMHPSMRDIGTVTTRMACQKTTTAGPLHSAPKGDTRIRAACRAPRGWVYVTADFKQAEPFVMAALSGDPDYLADLQKGDINATLATDLYGEAFVPAEGKAPGTPSYGLRQRCKFGWLAACYGAAPPKVDTLLGVPGVLARWKATYPVFWAYADKLNRQQAVRLDSGHIVPLWDRFWVDETGQLILRTWADGNPKNSRLGLNAETQGTQADLLKLAMHRLVTWGWGWALRFFVHDEIVGIVPAFMADAFAAALQAAMTVRYRGVVIECDVTREGTTWQPQPTAFRLSEIEDVDDDE